MKKLGVIGGMGPEATSYFYAKVIEQTKADSDQQHIDMIILSHASMPDRTEAIRTGHRQAFLKEAIRDAMILEQLGVSQIAIPCNTSHAFLPEIQAAVRVPILNMVKESVYSIQKQQKPIKKAGILATDGTLQCGLYQRAFEEAGIHTAVPEASTQRLLMSLIYDDVKSGSYNNRWKFDRAYESLLRQGCQAVLLACTELSVFQQYHTLPPNCIDAMDILVKESIRRSGARLRDETDRPGICPPEKQAEQPCKRSNMA